MKPSDNVMVCCVVCNKSVPIKNSIPDIKPFTYICKSCEEK